METRSLKWLLSSAMIIGLVVAGGAHAQEYLHGRTYYKDPHTIVREDEHTEGDSFEDYEQDAKGSGESAARARVVLSVKQKMDEALSADGFDGADKVTPDKFREELAKAQAGDGVAIARVAGYYLNGEGVEKNEIQAVEWYKRAIDYKQTYVYGILGDIYRENPQAGGALDRLKSHFSSSNVVQKDDAVARSWYEKGVAAGDWLSYMQLGLMYRDGAGGLDKDPKKAGKYYQKSLLLKKKFDEDSMRKFRARALHEAEVREGLADEYPGEHIGDQHPADGHHSADDHH